MVITDGDWKLFDYDFETGRSVWHYFDGEKDVFKETYPADQLVDENAAMRNAAAPGWKGDWHKVASIPLNEVYDKELHRAISEGETKYLNRYLNDSDNRAWRTKEGNI